jgi:hypothetical protein
MDQALEIVFGKTFDLGLDTDKLPYKAYSVHQISRIVIWRVPHLAGFRSIERAEWCSEQ